MIRHEELRDFFMLKKKYINGRIYHLLYNKGGRKYVAMYLRLLDRRGKMPYYKSYTNRRKKRVEGIRLAAKAMNSTMERIHEFYYFLIEQGLIKELEDGSIYVKGRLTINKETGSNKVLPIILHTTLANTGWSAGRALMHSNEKNQQRQIETKSKELANRAQSESEFGKGVDVKMLKKLYKKYGIDGKTSIEQSRIIMRYTEYVHLTLESLSEFFHYNRRRTKHCGSYYKKKLREHNVIFNRKYQQKTTEPMTYESYYSIKRNIDKETSRRLSYCKYSGLVYEEIPSEFRVCSI